MRDVYKKLKLDSPNDTWYTPYVGAASIANGMENNIITHTHNVHKYLSDNCYPETTKHMLTSVITCLKRLDERLQKVTLEKEEITDKWQKQEQRLRRIEERLTCNELMIGFTGYVCKAPPPVLNPKTGTPHEKQPPTLNAPYNAPQWLKWQKGLCERYGYKLTVGYDGTNEALFSDIDSSRQILFRSEKIER